LLTNFLKIPDFPRNPSEKICSVENPFRKFHKFQLPAGYILHILRKVEKNIIFGLILEKLWHTIGNERRLFPENPF